MVVVTGCVLADLPSFGLNGWRGGWMVIIVEDTDNSLRSLNQLARVDPFFEVTFHPTHRGMEAEVQPLFELTRLPLELFSARNTTSKKAQAFGFFL